MNRFVFINEATDAILTPHVHFTHQAVKQNENANIQRGES